MPWTKPTQEWCEALKTSQPGFTKETFDTLTPGFRGSPVPEIARVKVEDAYAQPWTIVLNPVYAGNAVGGEGEKGD